MTFQENTVSYPNNVSEEIYLGEPLDECLPDFETVQLKEELLVLEDNLCGNVSINKEINFENITPTDLVVEIKPEILFLKNEHEIFQDCDSLVDDENEVARVVNTRETDATNSSGVLSRPKKKFKKSLKGEQKTVNLKKFLCAICDKPFRRKCDLQRHLRCHTDEKRTYKQLLPCNICGKSFGTNFNLKRHLVTHDDDRNTTFIECTKCGKSFAEESYLKKHMIQHSDVKPHICTICGKTYPIASLLNQHKLRHSEDKPFKCSLCCKSYRIKGDLMRHLKYHNDERPFKCAYCKNGFKILTTLKYHLTWCKGEQPFKCETCLASFSCRSFLAAHERIHSGEKPFKCLGCNTGFIDKKSLSRHLNDDRTTKSKKKTYICAVCKECFEKSGQLQDHVKSHNKKRRV